MKNNPEHKSVCKAENHFLEFIKITTNLIYKYTAEKFPENFANDAQITFDIRGNDCHFFPIYYEESSEY